jgi:outer membrane lipase/esterase
MWPCKRFSRQAAAPRTRLAIGIALLAVALLSAPVAASAAGLNQFIGFGDSTMDSGYFRYNSSGSAPVDEAIKITVAAGGTGAFAGPGEVDTTLLAARFGLSAKPFIIGGGGGTNYANGAAQTAASFASNGQGLPNNVPIVNQISNYLAAVHHAANPDALYMISSGANDLLYVQTPGVIVSPTYLTTQATTLAASVATLQADGARTIVMLNVYDYARLVDATGNLSPSDAADYAQAKTFNAQIWSSLTAAGVHFIPADIDGVLKYVSQNPTKFGFTTATELASRPACTTPASLVCAPSQLITPDAEQAHLFADSHHLTTAGQTIESDYIYSLLTAPSQISLLAESAVQVGLMRATTIQQQIDLSTEHRGPNGINVWTSAGASTLTVKNAPNFPNVSGPPFGGTVGADYQLPGGVIVGAALTAGGLAQRFSTGGNYSQADEAMSLYAAYRSGPVWGNVIASYGLLQDHIARQVTLGLFTDQNNADTDGHSLALALRGGSDFRFGQVTTGPVVGVVLQQVHLNGFTETGTSGVTALSFGDQTRNSFVSQLGWRGSADLGNWQPFAEAEWNHEWGGRNRTLTASLTLIAAPSYTELAAPVASDWATVLLGVSYKLTPQVILRGAVMTMFANPQVISYGGELGVNVSF